MTSHRKLAAILSADVAGYSRLMADDEAATVAALHEAQDLFRAKIQTHQGRVIDTAGDSVLAEFASPVEAVNAAAEIQKELGERNASLPEQRRMLFRIGVNLGDVIEEGETLYGDGVNVAARLQALAEPGGICISGTSFDQVEGKLPLQFKFIGEQHVKNIPKPVRAYQLVTGTESRRPRLAFARKKPAVIAGFALAFAVAITAGSIWIVQSPSSKHQTADPTLAMPTGPSIAVLPFTNMSGDPNEDYFSDGLTEDIITELARFPELHVLARNTTFQFKGKAIDVAGLGRQLGVQYVIEGSVRKTKDKVRITAQLVDATSGVHIWADRYDSALKDLFAVQDEITTRIVGAVASGSGSVLQEVARRVAERKHPSQMRAYDLLLRAKNTVYVKRVDYQKRKSLLEQAIALDPTYARTRHEYAWLTLVGWILRYENTPEPPETLKRNAIESAELDPSDPLAHKAAAFAYFFDHQMDLFKKHAARALSLAPNNAEILVQLGFLTEISGDWDRGVALIKKAYALNPDSAAVWYHSGMFYDSYRKGDYRQAIEILRQSPFQDFCENYHKYVSAYGQLGEPERAKEYWEKCLSIEPDFSPERVNQLFVIWNQPDSLRLLHMQGFAKAGLPCKVPSCEIY